MTIYLIRHASAGNRNPSDPRDSERALDDKGLAQAKLLADWLGAEPVLRITSSPYLRCTQTVVPLSQALGLPIETDARLAESSKVEPAWEALADLAEEAKRAGRAVVVCSHGDVIPDLIRKAQLRGMRVHGKSGCSKGSVWKLNDWDGERFGSGSYTAVRPWEPVN